jgi:hypothetical protein
MLVLKYLGINSRAELLPLPWAYARNGSSAVGLWIILLYLLNARRYL